MKQNQLRHVNRKCCLCNALETLNEVIFASISHWITGDEVIIVPDGRHSSVHGTFLRESDGRT